MKTVKQIISNHYRSLSAKGNAARRGTEKARAHAAAISAKGVAARRRKAAERAAEQAASKEVEATQ
jgi:hypothetical protein